VGGMKAGDGFALYAIRARAILTLRLATEM
jgi:hypothetical protein